MYFVNRSDIQKRLEYIDFLLKQFKQQSFSTPMELLALERTVHGIIEAIVDVGNQMIDGFIMRDPGSYHDIIDILIDEQVIPNEDETAYKTLIDLRQMLVQQYLAIDHKNLAAVVHNGYDRFERFSTHIRTYLDNELDVANAFSNEDE